MYRIQVLSSKPLVSDLIANADLNLYPYRLIGDAVAVHAEASDEIKKTITFDPALNTGISTEYIEIPPTYINSNQYTNTVRISFTGSVKFGCAYRKHYSSYAGVGKSQTRVSIYHVLPDGSNESIEIGTYQTNYTDNEIISASTLEGVASSGQPDAVYYGYAETTDITGTKDIQVYPTSKIYLKIESITVSLVYDCPNTYDNVSNIDTMSIGATNISLPSDPNW